MKRRPHWDDDLITAVCATGDDGEVDYWMTSDQVYRIIAAVEDWQAQHARDTVYLAQPTSAGKAAIQRVREWCELRYIPLDLTDWQQGFLNARDEVQAILDGGDA